jgi:hypothetical protein
MRCRRRKRTQGDLRMDRRQFFGDSVAGTIVRLVLLSVVVGVVFSALGITPFNLIERLDQFVRNVLNMGFDAFNWAFRYFLLGAVIVVPVWFVMRLLAKPRDPRV